MVVSIKFDDKIKLKENIPKLARTQNKWFGNMTGRRIYLNFFVRHSGISKAEYLKQMAETGAPILAKVKGFISKVWLTEIEKNTFGGFYLWENKSVIQDFMNSDLVKAVVS